MVPFVHRLLSAATVATAAPLSETCPAALSLLQLGAKVQHPHEYHGNPNAETCSDLLNHGSYFTVQLEAGTPAQFFDVVADTGSDAVIIPSCVCKEAGECFSEDRCFTGTGNSTSFILPPEEDVPLMDLEFGSGSIKAAIATDVVRVGTASALMKEGLLLMVARHLDIVGHFEGILGLGQLQSEYSSDMRGLGRGASWDKPQQDEEIYHASQELHPNKNGVAVPGFLRKAHIDRFSLCFNDGESPGVLRLGTRKQDDGVPSVGTLHWGLNFNGFSVGSAKLDNVVFCGPDQKQDGVPCGAIPDSGTTVMLGPDDQVRQLFAAICDNWDRCATAARGEFSNRPKEEVFQLVLARCEDWLNEGEGLEEMPSVYMHVGGSKKSKSLELSAWSYVFESLAEDMDEHMQLLGEVAVSFNSEVAGALKKSRDQYMCAPAFGTSDYSSSSKGPVWIIGTPLFYEYVVGYDRSTTPPEVTFSSDPCGKCAKSSSGDSLHQQNHDDRIMILAEESEERGYMRRSLEVQRRRPRKLRKPPRVGRHWRAGKRVHL